MGNSGSQDPRYRTFKNEEDAPQPLNVIILGGHKVGKSTVGNAILGRKAFNSWNFFFHKGCVEKQGNVNDRFIKVVHAPGWTGFDHITSKYNKKEIMTSVSCCSEGLVACVLVVSIDSEFTEKDMKAAEQHMELIGRSVWEHTVLVFITRKPGKQKNLREIDNIKKCKWFKNKRGNSWHTLSKDNVNDLIEKLVGAATLYNGNDSCFKANNSAYSQESRMDSQCPEERTETENGRRQQENIEPQQQATTSIRRGTTQESNLGQENKKLLKRRHSMLTAIEFKKQKMAELCSFLISITKLTSPIDGSLEDFKHQSALFVDENRADLIERITTPIPIADSLLAKNMINRQLYDEIQKEEIKSKCMRLIYTALNAEEKKVAFLELLIQKDRCLVRYLAEKKLEAIMKICLEE